MRKTLKRRMLAWALTAGTGLLTVGQVATLRADERPSSMYEDDAWYDVTEWFDGNDYNPTDELWYRWDNETYEAEAAAKSSDIDTDDVVYGFYDKSTADYWYYDYDYSGYYDYDDYDYDGTYEMTTYYFDYDNDGFYDAYSIYTDTDGDGQYEDFNYMSFASDGYDQSRADGAKKDAKSNAANRSSKMFAVNGKVAATKEIQAQDGKHLVAHVTNQGRKFLVDLGSKDELQDTNLREGEHLTARGPVTKVGGKNVLLAREIEHSGRSMKIDRSPRNLTGTIVETMRAKPRKNQSAEHMMVKLKTDSGKQALIDLGPANNLDRDLKKDQKIDVSGVTVKVKERPVLFANNVTIDGKQVSIDRRSNGATQRQASNPRSTTQK